MAEGQAGVQGGRRRTATLRESIAERDLNNVAEGPAGKWFLWPDYCTRDHSAVVRKLDEDRFVGVVPMLFTWAVIVGKWEQAQTMYEDRWCYDSPLAAVSAVMGWVARGGKGEPEGWQRHPKSGRRRPGREYIGTQTEEMP